MAILTGKPYGLGTLKGPVKVGPGEMEISAPADETWENDGTGGCTSLDKQLELTLRTTA